MNLEDCCTLLSVIFWQLKPGMSARAQASLCPDRKTVFTVSQTEIVIKSSMKPTKTELRVVSRGNSYLHVVSRGNSYLHVVSRGNSYLHVVSRGNSYLHVVSRGNSYLHVVSRGNSYLHVVQAGNPGQCSAL